MQFNVVPRLDADGLDFRRQVVCRWNLALGAVMCHWRTLNSAIDQRARGKLNVRGGSCHGGCRSWHVAGDYQFSIMITIQA
ncbi:unnamed protein product [Ceratitis capitata]|uniref:(Mediterranean fruit fly) hypothetical protein n=1 Tax=Ceratitis capitata TaxID=7213 RepID=A0A811UYP2_CERCA|nr:unnamed protein product [Ceratitis capitata]